MKDEEEEKGSVFWLLIQTALYIALAIYGVSLLF
jgi:hypothetical protein|tara:strand:+ start:1173 stop:1274 length:102 start_codon:yes stop_codon:yes gene_type:complete